MKSETVEKEFLGTLKTPETLMVSPVAAGVPAGAVRHIQFPRQSEGIFFYTYKDIPGKKTVSIFESDIPFLADGDIRYEGETVLLVAAGNREALTHALEGLRVEYETNYTIKTLDNPDTSDILRMKHYRRGDSTKALKDAAHILEEEYFFPGFAPRVCGDMGAWAQYRNGNLDIYVTSGWIHHVRKTVSQMLNIDIRNVRVRGVPPGSSDDALAWYPSVLAGYAALCSFHTGNPALLELDPASGQSLLHRSPSVRTVFRTGIHKDGRVTGREIDVDMDAGAFAVAAGLMLDRLCVSALGIYGCPNFTVTGRIIRTNNPPADISCGAGIAPILAGVEAHANRTALSAGKDPLTFRMESLQVPYEHSSGIREKKNLVRIKKLLDTATALSDFSRKFGSFELNRKKSLSGEAGDAPRRGIGLAVTFSDGSLPALAENEVSGAVCLHLDTAGILSIRVSTIPGHSMTQNVWKQTAGAILGAPSDSIRIPEADTDLAPDAGPGILSRNITIIRNLIEKAAGAIQRRRFRSPLPILIKRSYRLPKSVTWDTNTLKGHLFHRLTWSAWVVEVSFDPVLLQTRVSGIWGALDCGRVLDKTAARCAVEEQIHTVLSHIGGDLLLPSPGGNFPLSIEFLDTPREEPRGISNTAYGGITAAFLSAAEQASYRPLYTLPITEGLFHRHGDEV